MRTAFFAAMAGLALAGTAVADVAWETDFARARQRAIKEDKLLFIDFYASW